MRVYHLLGLDHGLENLANRRIKISQFNDLNDPFELLGAELTSPGHRKAFRAWRVVIARRYGVLCYSRSWSNPVLWSHYADKHKGLCLGFDIQDELLQKVSYTGTRLKVPRKLDQNFMRRLLSTKYEHWVYEDEWRVFSRLEEPDLNNGLYFRGFDEAIRLREIIAGPRCNVTKKRLQDAISGYPGRVDLIKARLAFESYKVVKNKQGFRARG